MKERLLWEKDKSDKLINLGFQEFFYAKPKEKLHKEAIEFKFHSGIYWYDEKLKNRIDIVTIEKLEAKLDVTFPFHFKIYLKLLNDRKFNMYYSIFQINEVESIKIKEFYNINELEEMNLKSQKWLKIALIDKEDDLVLAVKNDRNLGKLRLEKEGKILTLCFQNLFKMRLTNTKKSSIML